VGRVDPALAAARAAVRAELVGLDEDDLVLVACSGGADSSALAVALATEAQRVGRSVRSRGHTVRAGAVIVDHGLQAGSGDVAARAAAQCRTLGLDPVVVRRIEVPPSPDGVEAAARQARYAALDDVAERLGAACVLLGHTLDDQAEQVLLGLARGSGGRSLAGMPRRRGRFRRPFLTLRRAQTEAVCAAVGLDPWHDPTNDADGGPLRSAVRGRLLPELAVVLGPGVVEALARSAALLRDDVDLLDDLARDLLDSCRVPRDSTPADSRDGEVGGWDGGAGVVLDVTVLADAPPALRRRALRAAALETGCPPGTTTSVHVDALDALVVRWRGQGEVHLPGGARASRACGRLFLRRPVAGLPPPAQHPEE
jgi:tRNA(Ile)-lysidine synthase